MEIERKWMVTGWPEGLTQTSDYQMDQGYVSVRPTVRIRREALQGGRTALVLCFKGAGTLSREEIETEIDAELFAKLEHLIGKPLIHKERRGYRLPGGLTLEVNCVDPDLPTAFWYAEVEFETEAQASCLGPRRCGPCRLPARRMHRQARQQYGGVLASDAKMKIRKPSPVGKGKNLYL